MGSHQRNNSRSSIEERCDRHSGCVHFVRKTRLNWGPGYTTIGSSQICTCRISSLNMLTVFERCLVLSGSQQVNIYVFIESSVLSERVMHV